MTRSRGWTLVELTCSIMLLSAVSLVVGGLATHAGRTRDLGAAYAADVAETRRALDAVERDVRSATSVRVEDGRLDVGTDAGDVQWRLDGRLLRRGYEVLARNVATFEVRRQDEVVDVTIELGRRSPEAKGAASVSTSVRLRAAQEAAK